MDSVYVIFLNGRGLIERIAESITSGPYCHCEVVVPGMISVSAWQGARCGAIEVMRTPFYEQPCWTWLRVPLDADAARKVRRFLLSKRGAPYNNAGFYGFLFPEGLRPRKSEGTYFCSELATEALQSVGWPPVAGVDPGTVSPNDLFCAVAPYAEYVSVPPPISLRLEGAAGASAAGHGAGHRTRSSPRRAGGGGGGAHPGFARMTQPALSAPESATTRAASSEVETS